MKNPNLQTPSSRETPSPKLQCDPTRKTALMLATEIADDLFTSGSGRKGDRLQLKLKKEDGSEADGGGWCYTSVRDRIQARLNENLFWSLSI